MNNIKTTIFTALIFTAIVLGLTYDSKINIDIAKASYNPSPSLTFPGDANQYLDGTGTWKALTPSAMGVASGTSAQYFDGTLSLKTFPTIPTAQIQADYTQGNTGSLDYVKNKPTDPYKSYQAILTQSGTGAPTITTGNNDFGATTFTWTRIGAGSYRVTASTAVFTSGKTVIIIGDPSASLVNYTAVVNSTTTATVSTFQLSVVTLLLSALNADSLLSNNLVEIRVYN